MFYVVLPIPSSAVLVSVDRIFWAWRNFFSLHLGTLRSEQVCIKYTGPLAYISENILSKIIFLGWLGLHEKCHDPRTIHYSWSLSHHWDFKIHSLVLGVETETIRFIVSVSILMLRLGFGQCQSRNWNPGLANLWLQPSQAAQTFHSDWLRGRLIKCKDYLIFKKINKQKK